MKTLFYIKSSPRNERSHSHKIVATFIERYQRKNPLDKIQTFDLFQEHLPPFDNNAAEAKYAIMHNREKTPQQIEKWGQIEKIIAQFKSADKYLMSVPMWNFSIPYKLKHYIDIICQPGYTFAASQTGYQGLLRNKPLCVIYSSGGTYENDSPTNFQSRYIEMIFRFMGFTEIKTVFCRAMLADEKTSASAEAEAVSDAEKIAESF